MPSRRGFQLVQYDNPEFEKLLAEAAAATSLDEANSLYQQAEALLADGLPDRSALVLPDHCRRGRTGSPM